MRSIKVLSIALMMSVTLSAQTKFKKFVYSVADTNQSERAQVESVYNWMINNISYDTKQLKKGLHEYTPEQTLKRKKAVCYGYSDLFAEMCDVLDIEAYIINGYCKGFGYVDQDYFTRSNHSWNIVYADKEWIWLDATWGAGGLYYDYSIYSKIMKKLDSDKGLQTKIKFQPEPTDEYYNIPAEKLLKTHFPIDSKWQFNDYPLPYKTFAFNEKDTLVYINYNRDLKEVRNHGVINQQIKDALNSPRYNPDNKFDIANAYYKMATQFPITKKTYLDTSMIQQFTINIHYCDSSVKYIKQFRSKSKTLYKTKNRKRKWQYRLGIKTMAKMKKIQTEEIESYHKEMRKIHKLEGDLKETKIIAQLELEKLENDVWISVDTIENYDTVTYDRYLQKAEDKLNTANEKMEQLFKQEDKLRTTSGTNMYQNDSILYNLEKMVEMLDNINASIGTMNEHLTFLSCVSLSLYYTRYDAISKQKKNVNTDMVDQYNKMQETYALAVELFNLSIASYSALAKLTGNNEPYTSKINEIRKQLYDLHRIKIRSIALLRAQNDGWETLLTKQNEIMESYGKKELKKLGAHLGKYYNFVMGRSTMYFNQDMTAYEKIRNNASFNKKTLKMAIREIKKMQ